MKYVAIDFETASGSSASACSVGLVKMDEEGMTVDRFYSLIKPKEPVFDPVCFSIHHLDPLDIMAAPSIASIWPEMRSFIGSLPLVAHNAESRRTIMTITARCPLQGNCGRDGGHTSSHPSPMISDGSMMPITLLPTARYAEGSLPDSAAAPFSMMRLQ